MKQKYRWALAARLLLTALLVVGLLPATARAETTSGGKFILTVEAGGKLIVAPEYISYTQGQTVGEALEGSRHTFTFSGSFITAINGVSDNYSASDDEGEYDLGAQASEITHLYFSQRSSADRVPSQKLLDLMTVMAQYLEKEPDVQKAAAAEYEKARSQFIGVKPDNAGTLAYNLQFAIGAYEATQNGDHYSVTFTDADNKAFDQQNYAGVSVSAQNSNGKKWEAANGSLSLPKGNYTFRIRWNNLEVSFERYIEADTVISESLDDSEWLQLKNFRLSGSYGAANNDYSHFTDDEFEVDSDLWENRTITVPVPDTFSGKVYTYAVRNTSNCYGDPGSPPTITAVYTMQNEKKTPSEAKLTFQSAESGAESVLARGGDGNTVVYRICCKRSGRTYVQDYTVHFVRIPTLTGIKVEGPDVNGETVDQAPDVKFSPDVTEYTYPVLDLVDSVTITAQPLQADYVITVNGVAAQSGAVVEIHGTTPIEVQVSHRNIVNTYTLNIKPGEGKSVSFLSGIDVSLKVINANGIELPYTKYKEGGDQQRHYYTLVPGDYTYIATYKDYYHVSNKIRFTTSSSSQTKITIDEMGDWLEKLSIGAGGPETWNKDKLLRADSFDKKTHFYRVSCYDLERNPYLWIQASPGITNAEIIYTQRAMDSTNHGVEVKKPIDYDNFNWTGRELKNFLVYRNPVKNTLTIRLSKEMNGVSHYQDYVVEVNRILTLADLTAQCDGKEMTLLGPNGELDFQPKQTEYDVKVSMAAQSLDLSFACHPENVGYNEAPSPYRVLIDGKDVTAAGGAAIELDGTINTQVVRIQVENEHAPEGTTVYTLNILKSPPVTTSFDYAPEEALLNIREVLSGQRLWPDEKGNYELCEGYSYDYALTQYGYISRSGTLTVTQTATQDEEGKEVRKLVILDSQDGQDGQEPYPVQDGENGAVAAIDWGQMQPAPQSSLSILSSQWPNFRGRNDNNAITNALIPDQAENGTLYWAEPLGDGYDADAVGSPILVDGDIITYAGDHIFRIDSMTGEVKLTGEMDHKSSFSITPPTYWEGMVFVALSDGCVQAFNAETLESLWIYEDPLGGQPNCPITVKDGYLYTGFWKSETAPARFVCLSVTDEDPDDPEENKCASWFHTADGGFYWAGAYVGDGYVLVGTDDGTSLCTSQTSSMLLLDAKTGAVLDSWDALDGDIRCTVVYDQQTDAFYFTSKGGTFYSLQVEEGKFTNQWNIKLQNGSEEQPPMSTSSPVVYNNRAYVGVSGSSQFGQYSGHNITVLDVNQREIVYSVPTQGYPQTSGLLTTAYGEDVYVYFFDNYTPGKLRVLRDRVGQGKAEFTTLESYKVLGVEYDEATAYALFTPVGEQAQYAICSPITDEYGTTYFKNDSGYLMAFGRDIVSIEVTKEPDKMTYNIGETFDPTGMQVVAHYANDPADAPPRDITPYISYSQKALTAQDENFTISFDIVLYQNKENGSTMTAGVTTTPPSVNIGLTIKSDRLGDVNGDGKVDEADAQIILDCEAKKKTEIEIVSVVADVSGDGKVNSDDAVLILRFYEKKLTSFPAEKSSGQPSQEQKETGSGDTPENSES